MFRIRYIALAVVALLFEGCTCCAYLNHMFNAERIYDEATEMRTARLDSVSDPETSTASSEERMKYDKVIEKGSRVLERFPKNKKRTAEAVFLIGESFRHKGEWGKAIIKYDEFERYFADHDSMRTVEYQRAYCLYKNLEYNISRFALEPVIADKKHPYYFQGLNLLSLLDEQSEHPDQAIDALEAVLADTAGTPFMKEARPDEPKLKLESIEVKTDRATALMFSDLIKHAVATCMFNDERMGFDGTTYFFGNSIRVATIWSPDSGSNCKRLTDVLEKAMTAVRNQDEDELKALLPEVESLTEVFKKLYPKD